MSKQRIIIILGVLVAVMPYLGFPLSWRKGFFLVAGIAIAITAYRMGRELKALRAEEEDLLTSFKDNLNEHENKTA